MRLPADVEKPVIVLMVLCWWGAVIDSAADRRAAIRPPDG
jgi:hypothetical protein